MGSTSTTLLGRLRDLSDAQAWQQFAACYRPRILAWCRSKGLQQADAENLTQNVLMRVAKRMPSFVYSGNFSGWLRTVWQNAWIDSLKDTPPPGGRGTGDASVYKQLANVETNDFANYLREEFEREVLHEALARVRPQVSPRDWDIFHQLLDAKSASQVAKERDMTLAAVGMVKVRVQRRVMEEIAKLEGTAKENGESQP